MLLPYSSVAGSSLPGAELLRAAVQVALDHHAEDAARCRRRSGRRCRAPRRSGAGAACCCWRGCSRPSAGTAAWPPRAPGTPRRRWRRRSSAPCRRAGSRGSRCCPWSRRSPPGRSCAPTGSGAAARAAWIASIAILMLPSVPFLKPIGADRPEASSRCTWLSVVRAPIAPQLIRSPMYCGRDHVEELAARRQAEPVDVEQQLARDAQALVDAEALVEVRVVDQALPADRRARLLEVHAHHDLQRVGVALALALAAGARTPARPPGRGSSTARSPPAAGRPCRA